jgi:hypothetical protein
MTLVSGLTHSADNCASSANRKISKLSLEASSVERLHILIYNVNHDVLPSKLNFYGKTGNAYEWIKLCFSNRFQRVEIKNENPIHITFWDRGAIKYGVPQGSVSGPLLFLPYINDLPKTINGNSKPILFTDDTSVIITNSNFEDFKKHITTEFTTLNMWFKSSKLTINFGKIHFMQFTTKNSCQIDTDIN